MCGCAASLFGVGHRRLGGFAVALQGLLYVIRIDGAKALPKFGGGPHPHPGLKGPEVRIDDDFAEVVAVLGFGNQAI